MSSGYPKEALSKKNPYNSESAEESTHSCYAVVYKLEDRTWTVTGDGGWSEVHLCRDNSDNTYRLLAWTVKSKDILLNVNCTSECTYKEKSSTFHSFMDERGQRHGLGFHNADSGVEQGDQFLKGVVNAIEELKKLKSGTDKTKSSDNVDKKGSNAVYRESSSNILPPEYQSKLLNSSISKKNVTFGSTNTTESSEQNNDGWSGGLPPVQRSISGDPGGLPSPVFDEEEEVKQEAETVSPVTDFTFEVKKKMSIADLEQPEYHLSSNQIKSIPKGTPMLGKLTVFAPKPQKFQKQDDKISDVTDVERKVQVTFDMEKGIYQGLPKEWEEMLNKQFGLSPKHIPGIKLPQYTAKIPRVLVLLKTKLVEADGYQQVGIFRLAPDARDNQTVKSSIDSGQFGNQQADVNVYANLIKVWFRDLPDPLLNCVLPERVEMATKEEDVVKVIADFPEPQKSIFLWLCDMCVECAVYETVNKMGPKNLAIVIGPNLFNTTQFENPMKAMTYSAKVVEFFEKAIRWRQAKQ